MEITAEYNPVTIPKTIVKSKGLFNGKNESVKVDDFLKELTEGTGIVYNRFYSIAKEEDGSFSVSGLRNFESWEFDTADLHKAIAKFRTLVRI